MAKKTKTTTPRWDYPKPLTTRVGIKVRWNYYDNEADARKAAEIARDEGAYWAERGYDYGYCAPGSVYKPDPRRGGEFGPYWEVTLP